MANLDQTQSSSLDLLVNYYGDDTKNFFQAEADPAYVPQALSDQTPVTNKHVILYHLQEQTTPDNDFLQTIPFQPSGRSVNADGAPVDAGNDQLIENWLVVMVDVVFVVLDAIALGDAVENVNSATTKQAIARGFAEASKSIFEEGLETLGDASVSSYDKAKVLFGGLQKAWSFGMFHAILEAVRNDLHIWDYIRDSVEAIAQLLAWFASDGVAAIAELILAVESLESDGVSLFDDINTALRSGSLQDAVNALGEDTSVNQKYTPAVVSFGGSAYVITYQEGSCSLVLMSRDLCSLSCGLCSKAGYGEQLQNSDADQVRNDLETYTDYSPWANTVVIPTLAADGTNLVPIASPAACFDDSSNTLYVFFQVADSGTIYYLSTKDAVSWSRAVPIQAVTDNTCTPVVTQCASGWICAYVSTKGGTLRTIGTSDFLSWDGPNDTNPNAKTSTTPGAITIQYGSGPGLNVYFAGYNSDINIGFTYSNPQTPWKTADTLPGSSETVRTPVPCFLDPNATDKSLVIFHRGVKYDHRLFKSDWTNGVIQTYDDIYCQDSPAILDNRYVFYLDENFNTQYFEANT